MDSPLLRDGGWRDGLSKSAPASPLKNRQRSLPDARDTASETQAEGAMHASLWEWAGEALIWS